MGATDRTTGRTAVQRQPPGQRGTAVVPFILGSINYRNVTTLVPLCCLLAQIFNLSYIFDPKLQRQKGDSPGTAKTHDWENTNKIGGTRRGTPVFCRIGCSFFIDFMHACMKDGDFPVVNATQDEREPLSSFARGAAFELLFVFVVLGQKCKGG